MFDKEAEEWAIDYVCKDCSRYEKCKSKEHCTCKECSKDKWQNGAEFGYQKGIKTKVNITTISDCPEQGFEIICKENAELRGSTNKWHKVADGDLPNDYRYAWTNVGASYYDSRDNCWQDEFGRTQGVIAWCEPKFEE